MEQLSAQAQRILAQGGSPQEARALAALAVALGGQPPAQPAATTAPGVEAGGRSEIPTLAVTLTPGSSANAAFSLKQRELLCDAALQEGTLQVDVVDAGGRPVPGVRIVIRWAGGEETIATGLYPSISPGYADYVMRPDEVYSIQAGSGEIVSELSTQPCPASSGPGFQGGWRLFFVEE